MTSEHRGLAAVRVLVVDDNATSRQVLCQQICAWNMQATTAADGLEALEKLRTAVQEGNPYDLALLDVHMPGMDGLTLASAIKADLPIAGTRIVALTSLGQAYSAEELRLADIASYLVKPIKQSRLFDCLVYTASKAPFRDVDAKPDVSAAPARSFQVDPNAEKARVLVAEDNRTNQLVAVGMLRKLGYEADIVQDGLAALEAFKSIPYDIILMDCQMPEMDGYDATRAIRMREQNSDPGSTSKSPVHIIALTGNAMQGDREKCLAAGMDDFLSKPIQLRELQAMLEHWNAGPEIRFRPEAVA